MECRTECRTVSIRFVMFSGWGFLPAFLFGERREWVGFGYWGFYRKLLLLTALSVGGGGSFFILG